MTGKEELFKLLKEKSFYQGKVTLSSGKESAYYWDCKKTSLDPYGAYLIAYILWERLQTMMKHGVSVDAVGGPTIGADPIVGALIIYSYINGIPLSGFMVRKEPKGHGMKGRISESCPSTVTDIAHGHAMIEGDLAGGSRVVIIEDVTTTGASTIRAIKAIEELGCRVIKIFSLIDRDEGSREVLKGYDYEPIFTARQFLENL